MKHAHVRSTTFHRLLDFGGRVALLGCALAWGCAPTPPLPPLDAAVDATDPTDATSSDASRDDVATLPDAQPVTDAVTAGDVVTSSDVVAPRDAVAPIDVVAPTDVVAPIDVVTPTDAPRPVDAPAVVDAPRPVDVTSPADAGCAATTAITVLTPSAGEAIETCSASESPVFYTFTARASGPVTGLRIDLRDPAGDLAPPSSPTLAAAPYAFRRQVGGRMVDVPPLAVFGIRGDWHMEVTATDACGRTVRATQAFTLTYTTRRCPNP